MKGEMSPDLKNVKFYHGVGNLADSRRVHVTNLSGEKGKARQYKKPKKETQYIQVTGNAL